MFLECKIIFLQTFVRIGLLVVALITLRIFTALFLKVRRRLCPPFRSIQKFRRDLLCSDVNIIGPREYACTAYTFSGCMNTALCDF